MYLLPSCYQPHKFVTMLQNLLPSCYRPSEHGEDILQNLLPGHPDVPWNPKKLLLLLGLGLGPLVHG